MQETIPLQQELGKSRELFDQAAQRSLMAVLNPRGWLKFRPITILNLPPDKYGGYMSKLVMVQQLLLPTPRLQK